MDEGAMSAAWWAMMLGAALAGSMVTLMALWAQRRWQGARVTADPLAGLFKPERFEAEIAASERRNGPLSPRGAMLRARVDPMGSVGAIGGMRARAEAAAQVAQVMRAGVRRADLVDVAIEAEGPQGDGSFVILARGASEAEASGIAKRLIRDIAHMKVPGIGDNVHLTSSFGVAARRLGESDADWHARANAAMKAAEAAGEDQVVTASEWEEIKLLPAPAPSNEVPVSKAA